MFTGNRRKKAILLAGIAGAVSVVVIIALVTNGTLFGVPSVMADDAGEAKDDKPKLDPIEFSKEPLWSNRMTGGPLVPTDVEFHADSRLAGNRVILTTSDENGVTHFTALSAKNGETVWSREEGDELGSALLSPHGIETVITPGSRPTLLTGYSKNDEQGIVALSTKDGEPLWTIPVIDHSRAEVELSISAATGKHIAVGISDQDDDSSMTAFVDIAERRTVWVEKGVTPSGIADDTVIVKRPKDEGASAALMGLRAGDGKRAWNRPTESTVVIDAVTSDLIVTGARGETVFIDPRSGEELGVHNGSLDYCDTGDPELIVCQVMAGTDELYPVTIRRDDDNVEVTELFGCGMCTLLLVHKGRIFVEDGVAKQKPTLRTVDAEGRTIDTGPLAVIREVNDDYALFQEVDSSGVTTISVHSVS